MILLDAHQVYTLLKAHNCPAPFKLYFHECIDSTNNFVKNLPLTKDISVCCAETQTQGRGRFGRVWHSPFGENIYCSIRWHFDCDLTRLSGLGLVISLAIVKTLQDFDITDDISIKWPNDILWQDRKLAGLLIETQLAGSQSIQATIGIGLNINSDTEKNPLPDRQWTSVFQITGKTMDRNRIVAGLLHHIATAIPMFIQEGLDPFLSTFARYDALMNKHISVMQDKQGLQGQALGIDRLGRLLLRDESNTMHALCSGETTLRQSKLKTEGKS